MRNLIETEGLPEPKRHQAVWEKSLGRRTASIAVSLALAVGVAAPLPTVRTDFGMASTPSPDISHNGVSALSRPHKDYLGR